MFLNRETFEKVVESVPLVSVDLVLRDHTGRVLLGRRLNRPAKGYWFVPGGRIYKGESIENAIKRISLDELGLDVSTLAKYIGAYTHFYDDSIFGAELGTHYIVLAFAVDIEPDLLCLPYDDQHDDYIWWSEEELLVSELVHTHTKWYFGEENEA